MALPSFLVIGAAKSGTTSIHNYLCQHPSLLLPRMKETNFFAYEGVTKFNYNWYGDIPLAVSSSVTNLETYSDIFSTSRKELILGEVCPLYLYNEIAPLNIKKHVPEVKIILILRNPVERAYSHYSHLSRYGRESCVSFEQSLEEEEKRISNNWIWEYHYAAMGFYAKQLRRYYENFPSENIKIFSYEELQRPNVLMKSVFDFIGADSELSVNTSGRYNVSGTPKNLMLYKFLMGRSRVKNVLTWFVPKKYRLYLRPVFESFVLGRPKSKINPEIYLRLLELYRHDIEDLQCLTNRDFSSWLINPL